MAHLFLAGLEGLHALMEGSEHREDPVDDAVHKGAAYDGALTATAVPVEMAGNAAGGQAALGSLMAGEELGVGSTLAAGASGVGGALVSLGSVAGAGLVGWELGTLLDK